MAQEKDNVCKKNRKTVAKIKQDGFNSVHSIDVYYNFFNIRIKGTLSRTFLAFLVKRHQNYD